VDPDVLQPNERQYYNSLAKWERPKSALSPEALTKDIYAAHDRIKDLVKENDRLRSALIVLKLEFSRTKKTLIQALLASWLLAIAFWRLRPNDRGIP